MGINSGVFTLLTGVEMREKGVDLMAFKALTLLPTLIYSSFPPSPICWQLSYTLPLPNLSTQLTSSSDASI